MSASGFLEVKYTMLSLVHKKSQDTTTFYLFSWWTKRPVVENNDKLKQSYHEHREDPMEPFHYAENILLHKPGGSGPSSTPTLSRLCTLPPHSLAMELLACSSLCRTLLSPK